MVTYLFNTHITYVDQGQRRSSARAAFNGDDPKFIQTHVVDGRVIFQIEEGDKWFAIGGKIKHSPWTYSIDHLMDMANLHDLHLHPVVLTLPDIWGGVETLVVSKRGPYYIVSTEEREERFTQPEELGKYLTKQYGEWEEFEWINDDGAFIWCKPWSRKAVYMPVGNTIIRG
jgi:hypothetical protein